MANTDMDLELYALCKKYCDEHSAQPTPEQVYNAIIKYLEDHPGTIVTKEYLETTLLPYATENWVEENFLGAELGLSVDENGRLCITYEG